MPFSIPIPSGGGLIPDPHTSPLQNNGTKRTGLKISFSQPNLRKAGQMNLKFPATGYEATPEKFSIYSKASADGLLAEILFFADVFVVFVVFLWKLSAILKDTIFFGKFV